VNNMHGKPFKYKEEYVVRWAEYVISHSDWSAQQAQFINSQIRNARQIKLTREQVDEIKKKF